jgi:hypothetical protein
MKKKPARARKRAVRDDPFELVMQPPLRVRCRVCGERCSWSFLAKHAAASHAAYFAAIRREIEREAKRKLPNDAPLPPAAYAA